MDGRRRISVVARDFIQALLRPQCHESRVRNHFALFIRHIEIVQVLRQLAILWISLDVELEELAKLDEALLVSAADEDGEIVHRLADRDAFLHGDLVVDDELLLRIIGAEECEEAPQLLALAERLHELVVHHLEVVVVAGVRLVEQAQREAAGCAIAGHCGRFVELDGDTRDLFAAAFELGDDLRRGHLAVRPVLQVDQAGARVRSAAFGEHFIARER